MKTLADIQNILTSNMDIFQKTYQVTTLGIFGSYARQEQTETSDVDILIDYDIAPTLSMLVDLRSYLSELVGMPVDVVTKNGLSPKVREQVLADVVYL